jgi:hypothetical protein
VGAGGQCGAGCCARPPPGRPAQVREPVTSYMLHGLPAHAQPTHSTSKSGRVPPGPALHSCCAACISDAPGVVHPSQPVFCREDAEKAVIEVLFKPRNGLAGAAGAALNVVVHVAGCVLWLCCYGSVLQTQLILPCAHAAGSAQATQRHGRCGRQWPASMHGVAGVWQGSLGQCCYACVLQPQLILPVVPGNVQSGQA